MADANSGNVLSGGGAPLSNLNSGGASSDPGVTRTKGAYSEKLGGPGLSLQALTTDNGDRAQPGFTPPEFYDSEGGEWYGKILQHLEYTKSQNPLFTPSYVKSFSKLNAASRFNESKDLNNKGTDPLSTRDYYYLFNDLTTDYFKHGINIVNQKRILTEDGGINDYSPNTPYENSDPTFYGFEIIIDAVSSPLLNGAVEDFIDQFSNVSEIASKKRVIGDFKRQFIKLFKTKGTPKFAPDDTSKPRMSIDPLLDPLKAGTPTGQKQRPESGKKAYFSYYIKKISGLGNLIVANSPTANKYITDYRKDILTITMTEDVSATAGTLAHLYKLLYWSKPNGKSLIPANLLRFNCSIVVSECRHFNRVRKSIENGDIQVIKENLSRHIYTLRECQFYFDKPAHDPDIDLEGIKDFAGVDIAIDYKYVSNSFERWVPDGKDFGQYVAYNAGAIWKVGNKGARQQRSSEAPGLSDVSTPRFYTVGKSQLPDHFVTKPVIFKDFPGAKGSDVVNEKAKEDAPKGQEGTDTKTTEVSTKPQVDGTDEGAGGDNEQPSKRELRRKKFKEGLEKFKENSKNRVQKIEAGIINKFANLPSKLANIAKREARAQFDIRMQLLKNTLDRISEVVSSTPPPGQKFFKDGPYNVYRFPKSELAHFNSFKPEPEWSGAEMHTGGPYRFFDVRNSVDQFMGGVLSIYNTGDQGINDTVLPPRSPNIYEPSKTTKQAYGADDINKVQFPAYAHKYPAPVIKQQPPGTDQDGSPSPASPL